MNLFNLSPERQHITGFCLGTLSGFICALIIIFLARLVFLVSTISKLIRYKHKPEFPAPTFELELEQGLISTQALAMLKSHYLIVNKLPVLGIGGGSTVHKGALANGLPVAIKRVSVEKHNRSSDRHSSWWSTHSSRSSSRSTLGKHPAESEVETLGRIRHKNLTRLYAYLRTSQEYLLVYHLAANGSLRDCLSSARRGESTLDWRTRKNIALGIAMGLKYLHFDCTPGILHRDIKTSNILLDEDFDAQLSDFGLAREIPPDVTHVTMNTIAGTVGYFAPEYTETGKFSMASDVYSLGVVFGALLSGREPNDSFFSDVEGGMVGWMNYLWQSGQEYRGFDTLLSLEDKHEIEEMKLLLRTVCYCTRKKPSTRPSSKLVVQMLQNARTLMPKGVEELLLDSPPYHHTQVKRVINKPTLEQVAEETSTTQSVLTMSELGVFK